MRRGSEDLDLDEMQAENRTDVKKKLKTDRAAGSRDRSVLKCNSIIAEAGQSFSSGAYPVYEKGENILSVIKSV